MIFRGSYPEVTIPDSALTPFVFARARELGDKPALIDGATGRATSYAELDDAVRRVAASLAARGLAKGDVFAILSPNAVEYAVAFHAVALAGGVVTTLNPLGTAEEIAKQLTDSRAKYVLAAPALHGRARAASAHLSLRELFVFGECDDAATPFAQLYESDGVAPEVPIDPREDLVALPYSSGTTGTSKGVMLTHRNLVANLRQIEGTEHARGSDTLVGVLPMFHIYGMNVIMNFGLYQGATTVVLPRFDLEEFLGVMEQYKVTMAHVVPPIVLALAKHPAVARYDLTSLRTIFSGAAPLGERLAREVSSRLGCHVKQGYGMTESSPATHMAPDDPARAKHGSVGLPVPNTECRLIDVETGAELGADSEGEICVRGPQVMKGYLNRPDATQETVDSEGWLHTGDIGYADREGHFFIVDRKKELIKYKGFQVAPAELEALLLTHPSVADAAVIPSPDEEAGEVPKAFVVLKTDQAATAEELIAFVAARVSPYKKVRLVEFVEQIPKSPSGKILRRVLVARERAERK
ncbi:MAG: 4-coumarate--CoA ligase family protein [Acidobacteria bacterium]|nr:4-coumarate--CoA ligase family protein [Acidobacteriota bacterium]MCA1642715.1 4-coumarate--CoA ligase family protein [Acidobacteriota bacterium]